MALHTISLTFRSICTTIRSRSGTLEENEEEIARLLEEAKEEYEEQREVIKSAHGVKIVTVPASVFLKRRRFQDQEPGPLDVKCEKCGKILAAVSYINKHMNMCLGKKMPISRKCHWCEKVISFENLEKHARNVHFWGKFSCLNCNLLTSFATELIAHVNEAHGDDPGALCPSCHVKYSILEIECHYKECIIQKRKEKDRKIAKCDKICDTCGKKFKRKSTYLYHMRAHRRDQAAANGEEGLAVEDLFWYCDKCEKKFGSRSGLKLHKSRVHENAKFLCPSCPMIFDTANKVRGHQNMVHSTDFLCQYCGKRCRGNGERKAHEKRHELPRLKCKYCDKMLAGKKSLEVHERYHTGEKNFPCSLCSNKFVSKHKLQQHERGAHKIPGPMGGKVGWGKRQK